MKLKKTITTLTIATLFMTSIYADANATATTNTMNKTKDDVVAIDVKKSPVPPTVGSAVLDVSVTEIVTTGFRASKLIHSAVHNIKGEKVGTIDDFIVGGNGSVSFAVLSVGSFLGLDKHLVIVPAVLFESDDKNHIILPNATKEDLKSLPAFKYAR